MANLPIYRVVSAWDPSMPPPPVRPLLRRFHRANVVRLGAALAASVLFFLAA